MARFSDIVFEPRVKFGRMVFERFGCTVSPVSSQSPSFFKLVASFERSAIRLSEDTVGLLLQSRLGGPTRILTLNIYLGDCLFYRLLQKRWILDQELEKLFLQCL
jgi:hypothetical protein